MDTMNDVNLKNQTNFYLTELHEGCQEQSLSVNLRVIEVYLKQHGFANEPGLPVVIDE